MDDKGVWIAREEYDRIIRGEKPLFAHAANSETTGGANSQTTNTLQSGSGESELGAQGKNTTSYIVVCAIMAVLSFFFPPLILIFLIAGLVTLGKHLFPHSRKIHVSKGFKVTMLVIGIPLVILAGPQLLLLIIFLPFLIGCGLGSSCHSV